MKLSLTFRSVPKCLGHFGTVAEMSHCRCRSVGTEVSVPHLFEQILNLFEQINNFFVQCTYSEKVFFACPAGLHSPYLSNNNQNVCADWY